MRLPVFTLALTAFALGTAELMPNGLLPEIADDLELSVGQAGWVATSFALGAMLGGPLLAAATLRAPRRGLVVTLALGFAAANAVTALTTNLPLVMGSRAVAGALLGGFLGTAVTIARSLVPPDRGASAIAVVFTGFTVSNVIAVPIGNFLGRSFGWQGAFWLVTVLAVLGGLAMARALPRSTGEPATGGVTVLATPRLWVGFAAIALSYGGLFVLFTYIAPFLTDTTGFGAGAVPWLLLLFGVGLVGGNIAGGHFADRALRASVVVILTALVAGLLATGALAGSGWAVALLLVVLGAAGFGMVPPLQSYVLHVAGTPSPLVSSLAAASFNGGVAFGSALGGVVAESTLGYDALPVAGAIVTALGLLLFVASSTGRRARASGRVAVSTA